MQVAIIPIGEKHQAYANEVGEKLKAAGVQVNEFFFNKTEDHDSANRKADRSKKVVRQVLGTLCKGLA